MILYRNAKIFTADKDNPWADAMLVEDERIIWVGKKEECPEISGDIEKVDLGGRTVIPGLIDSHQHCLLMANFIKGIAALPPKIHNMSELAEAIKEAEKTLEPGRWIEGWGYDEGKLEEKRKPNRYDLDKGSVDTPVVMVRACQHIVSVNSKALEIAGITKDTPDPPGGVIGRDEKGEPDGILYENARNLAYKVMPDVTEDDAADNMLEYGKVLASFGVTAVSDLGELTGLKYGHIFEKAIERGLKTKVGAYFIWDFIKDDPDFDPAILGNDRGQQIIYPGIKLIGDGSISGHTAWLDRPYPGTDDCGLPTCTEEDIDEAKAFAKEHGCQLSIHCMGTAAIDRTIGKLWEEKPWMEGGVPTFRVEHITMPSEEAMERASFAGIPFVTQPVFMFAEMEAYLENLGHGCTKECYPVRTWLDKGIRVAFSTDAPATAWAEPYDPFVNIQAAVTRRAWDGTDCGQDQRVSLEEAIRLYTAESGPMMGFRDIGVLKEGYSADFVVLDRDIFEMPCDKISEVRPAMTFINGERVY
jgi:predicted amidohydrolase YtcJ